VDSSKLTEKAAVAAERGQYDYAIDLYLRLLDLQPQHVDARKALRAVEIRRCQERGMTKSGASGWLRGIGHLVTAVIHLLLRKPEKSIVACESFLKNDPFNTTVLRLLARAAEKAGHLDVAILVLEDVRVSMGSALKGLALRSRVKVARKLGALYAQSERLPLAAERFEEVLKLVPNDREAEVRIRDIAAQRSMSEGGWDKAGKAGGYRDVLKDEDSAKRHEDTNRDIRTREDVLANIERVKDDLVKEPGNTRHLVQLGDLYKMLRDWDRARAQYEKAKVIDPLNFMVSERLGDLRLAEMDEEIEGVAADPAKKDALARLRRERMKAAFEEYQRRAKARPQDLPTRFALANILFEAGRFKDASAQFQLASRDPRHRRTALYRLGVCFQKQNLVDLAVEQFEKAIAGASLVDAEVKDILYALGEAHEGQGRFAEALNAYKRVFEIDIGYRDVSKKLEELYNRGAKDTS